ncbi:MAG: hypothetical protein JWP09_626 [Candidatus Taylorbacteria bacterium]|nr:hypothetical protein [Candidatus Taylorbacteria bacterium]
MKIKNALKIGFLSLGIMFLSFSVPLLANAATGDPATDPNFQLVSTDCGQTTGSGTINRECGWGDLIVLLNRILKYIIFISATIAVMMFVYAGFLYLTAFGEMGKVEQAHKIFSTTIMGVIIIMLAWLIVATVLNVLEISPEFTILENNTSDRTPPVLPSDGSSLPNA